jgi:hypothetical protein
VCFLIGELVIGELVTDEFPIAELVTGTFFKTSCNKRAYNS